MKKKRVRQRRGSRRPEWGYKKLTILLSLVLARVAYTAWKAMHAADVKKLEAEGKQALSYRRETHKVAARDGTRLVASVWIPEGEGPFPAVIMVHSWMFSRTQCDMLYAAPFARRGYVVLTYTCRGWGTSGGEVHCAAPDKELSDLEDMIDWLTDEASGFPVDTERLGITGISYGGGHSFLAATRDERIKTAVPMNGWTDLYHALLPNECWKAPWSVALFLGGIWAHRCSPGNILVRWLWTFIVKWDPHKLRGELDARSARFDVDKVKCPMFIVHSWNDDLFDPNQVIDFYLRLKVPKRLHISNGIHGMDPGRGDYLAPNRIWDETRQWFDYWLKDERGNGMDSEPAVTFFQPWNKKMGTAENWPPEGFADVRFYLRGAAAERAGFLSQLVPDGTEPEELIINNSVSSLQTSGPAMVRLNAISNMPIPGVPFTVPGDSLAFTSEPFTVDTALVGAPGLTVHATSSTQECQLNALLFDVSPRGFCRLVTHGAMMKREMTPEEAEEFDFELIACAHRFKKGHRARLVLCAADPMYVFPSLVPSKYLVMHDPEHKSSVTMPLMAVTE